ncbi:MAG: LPS-assembly protein LptD [Acidobacteria bacterium]|nr:LPS-assembly protein LptD [Acidobacteriota bacterium]
MKLRTAIISVLAAYLTVSLSAQVNPSPEIDRVYREDSKFRFDFSSAGKGGKIKWKFDRQEAVKDEYAILEGNVVVEYQDVKLSADRVTVNIKTRDVDAQGNVVIDQGTNRLAAERAIFNLDSKIGTLFNARAAFEGSIFFSGSKIEKLDADTFRLTDGVFTSCDIDNPAWSFRVSTGVVTIDDYARLKNLSFRAKKLPLFWTPYIVWPTKRDRSRGFLIPKFGSSDRYGTHVGISYFIPHGEWADTTLQGDYYSEGFNALGIDTRYVPSEGTAGRFQGQVVNDPDANLDGSDSVKWRYTYKHTQDDLPGGFRGVIDLTNFSDIEFFRRFDDDFEINTISNIYSSAYLTKNAGEYSLNIKADRREQLISSGSQIYEQLPSVQYRVYPNRLGASSLYYSLESSAGYLRSNDADYFRGDIFPTLSLQLRTPLWLSVKPTILGRYTYYTQSLDETSRKVVDESIDRTYGQGLLEIVGPSFSKIVSGNLGGFERFKHVIEPRVRFTHTTQVENLDQVIRFDTVDSPSLPLVEDYVEYSLVQRIIAKKGGEGAAAREILSFTVKQAASLAGPINPNSTNPTEFSPITFSLVSNPSQNVSFDASALVGNESRELEQSSLSVNLQGPRAYFALRWFATYQNEQQTTFDSSQIQLRAGVPIVKDRLRGDVQFSYDAEREDFLEQRYILGYSGSCWGIRGEYRDLTVPVPTQEYVIAISLQNVGTLFDFTASANSF